MATSGIGVSPDLSAQFSHAVDSKETRFLKVSIQNESLVHDLSIPIQGTLAEDLTKLQTSEILHDDTPAYVLTKLDDPATEWLAIYFVPDTAKVRDKMLYASTRASLLKSLGSTLFTDSIFATSKADLTPEAYEAHRKHILAPKPLSASEQELANVRAAEREAGGLGVYQGSRARTTHMGQTVGMPWSSESEEAVKKLGECNGSELLIMTIDIPTETLTLKSFSETEVANVGSSLPSDGASYAFYAWKHSPSARDIIFIYSCPNTCPVKQRMVYASGFNSVFLNAKNLLESASSSLHNRKIETSTPDEIDEAFLRSEYDFASGTSTPAGSAVTTPNTTGGPEQKPFARPKGPKRR
ncbi:unnamed protein product [Mycena citricolor]|uniref:ADF-H domain-containing protein n=1 Tax=Mycena citricolor TaxID=2018698 RepID=A0AAD2Q6H0_9AGAR|nr:unnamed protein product [Mycena citricolor]